MPDDRSMQNPENPSMARDTGSPEDTAFQNIEKRLNEILENIEAKSREALGRMKEDVLPQAEAKMRDNLWTSLLTALGVGLVLGLVLGLTSGRR